MQKFLLSAIALGLIATAAPAQTVTFREEGFVFPVVIEVDHSPGKPPAQEFIYWAKGSVQKHSLTPGEHSVRVRPWINNYAGFAQPVSYTVRNGNEVATIKERTTDVVKLELKKDSKLEIVLHAPGEPCWDTVFFEVKGVRCLLNIRRPQWHFGLCQAPDEKNTVYGNSLLFYADPKYGEKSGEKLYDELATEVFKGRASNNAHGCWLKHQLVFQCQLTENGSTPAAFRNATQKDIKEALIAAHVNQLRTKVWTFSAAEMKALQAEGYFPGCEEGKDANVLFYRVVEEYKAAQAKHAAWKEKQVKK